MTSLLCFLLFLVALSPTNTQDTNPTTAMTTTTTTTTWTTTISPYNECGKPGACDPSKQTCCDRNCVVIDDHHYQCDYCASALYCDGVSPDCPKRSRWQSYVCQLYSNMTWSGFFATLAMVSAMCWTCLALTCCILYKWRPLPNSPQARLQRTLKCRRRSDNSRGDVIMSGGLVQSEDALPVTN